MAHKIIMTRTINDEQVEDLIVTALEGGIGYWAVLANNIPEFVKYDEQYPEEPTSIVVSKILLDGGTVTFLDVEDADGPWTLTLVKLLGGLAQFWEEGGEPDLDNFDSLDADSVIQLALFKERVYC